MNSRMRALLDGLRERADDFGDESCGLFQIVIKVDDEGVWEWLRECSAKASQDGISIRVGDVHTDDGYDFLQDEFSGSEPREFKVYIAKSPVERTLRFLTIDGFTKSIRREAEQFEHARTILIAEAHSIDGTVGFSVFQWTDERVDSKIDHKSALPRRLVNDMSGRGLVPNAADVWMMDTFNNSLTETIMRAVAARRLSLCLPDAISIDENGSPIALVRTGRKISASIEDSAEAAWEDPDFYKLVSEVCRWIYLENREADVRHTLLLSELARVWQPESGWQHGLTNTLEGSFEAAKTAYRLHVQSKGVDAFKLMSDLRKGLTDDVRSVTAQTSTLSSGLWRDAAVAFGVVVVKAVTTSIGSWLIWLAAIYLGVSCFLTCRAASSAVNGIARNEESFRSKLYMPLLLDKEYRELAGKHYEAAIADFKCYRFYIIVAYALAIAALIYASTIPHEGVLATFQLVHSR